VEKKEEKMKGNDLSSIKRLGDVNKNWAVDSSKIAYFTVRRCSR
jgi:hypothetical protein